MSGKETSTLSIIVKIAQLIFYAIIAFTTIYTLRLTNKQSKLIFKPVVGVVDVKTTRHLTNVKEDSYDNVRFVTIAFVLKNVGNLPAKNLKISVRGKLGNTILPYTENDTEAGDRGVVLIQDAQVTNKATISKSVIDKLVKHDQKLTYTIGLSYSDWEEYEQYGYSSIYEIYVKGKEPLSLETRLLPQ
ncbi:MAG: hypothetical protein ISS63_14385 [Desulfobacteraceae bacterium]|nr:hypothetical protein [Desulfobacteraceae bacterium]